MSRGSILARIPERLWRGVIPSIDGGRFVGRIVCGQCGAVDIWRCNDVPEPGIVIGKFVERGWAAGQRTICPDCSSTVPEGRVVTFISECCVRRDGARAPAGDLLAAYNGWSMDRGCRVANEKSFGMALRRHGFEGCKTRDGRSRAWAGIELREGIMEKPSAAPVGSALAAKKRAEATQLLMDVFDVDRGRFKDGESDDTVARVVGDIAPQAVAKIREAIGFVIRVSPEILALDAELQRLGDNLSKTEADVSGMLSEFKRQIVAARLRLDGLKAS